MNHASEFTMIQAMKYGLWPGIDIDPNIISDVFRNQDCLACKMAKSNSIPRHLGSGVKSNIFGQVLSYDYVGPIKPLAFGGFNGMHIFTERSTNYSIIKLTKSKDNVPEELIQILSFFKSYKVNVEVFRCDAGSVEKGKEVREVLITNNIRFEPAPPESQQQNPVERFIQHLIKTVSTIITGQNNLPASFWGLAALYFCQTWNLSPNKLLTNSTPNYELTGKRTKILDVIRFQFGQPVISKVLQAKKLKKFDPANEAGYIVGTSGVSNGAMLVYIPSKSRSKIYV
jgi:transposase